MSFDWSHTIETWIFDLDNTLYPQSNQFFTQISQRMTLFIMKKFGMESEQARTWQKYYFQKYGTTLCGLMRECQVDPTEYLNFTHDIDINQLPLNPELESILLRLPGRKMIYTNATVKHATRILEHLNLKSCFCEIHDIFAADFIPKPDIRGYQRLVEKYAIDPHRACMVEDMAYNLESARRLGMKTVWLVENPPLFVAPHIDLTIDNLNDWLAQIVHQSRGV